MITQQVIYLPRFHKLSSILLTEQLIHKRWRGISFHHANSDTGDFISGFDHTNISYGCEGFGTGEDIIEFENLAILNMTLKDPYFVRG